MSKLSAANPVQALFPTPCDRCPVKNRAICQSLQDDSLTEFGSMSFVRSFEAGQTIVAQNTASSIVGTLTSGVAKMTRILADGRAQIVGLLFASDFLGRTGSPQHAYTIEAVTPVNICAFRPAAFEAFLAEHRELETVILERTLNELDCAREWMVLLGRKSAREKIATFLAILARRGLNHDCRSDADEVLQFHLPLSRGDMADYLGLTIETVSRQMTNLKTAGLIRLLPNRLIEVPDIDALNEVALADEF